MRLIIAIIQTLVLLFALPAHCQTSAPDAEESSIKAQEKLKHDANEAFWRRDFPKAKKDCLQLLDSLSCSDSLRARIHINLATCDEQMDNWEAARKESQEGVKLASEGSLTQADGLVTLAHCLVVDRKIDEAKQAYEKALSISVKTLGDWNADLAHIYEGLAACAVNQGKLSTAKELYTKVAQLDLLRFGPDDTQFGWSLLSLTNALNSLGEHDQARTLYKKVFWNFRHQNEERILDEIKPTDSEKEALVVELRRQLYGFTNAYDDRKLGLDYIEKGIPRAVLEHPSLRSRDFDNWFRERIGRETAPGLAFFDPRTKLKALIVTVHGLGLHHGAFTPFAERVQHEGLGVVSFDVRGFGSYRNDEVFQRVDFQAIIGDLQRILTALRRDYPGLPIYILGESMGGAIALRIAALSPNLVDGVVSSVPAGTRFHAKSTALEIAVKFMKSSNKQFNIGERVVGQATSDPQLRTAWEDDPSARMKLSPSELIAFQNFMNDNLKFAGQIKDTPVIIFQGYSDQLVRPLGTFALYQAIQSRDKDLVFVGHAEHLIFEEGQFEQDVVDGLVSWLNKHIAARKTAD